MAIQTRRCVSLRGSTYQLLREKSAMTGVSMSEITEEALAFALGTSVKAETSARVPEQFLQEIKNLKQLWGMG